MLAKPNRLKDKAKFAEIYKQGKRYYSPYFLLFILRDNAVQEPIFGFVASKKIGSAVNRNRSKRLLREAIKAELPVLKGAFSAIIIASTKTPTAKLEDIKTYLQQAFRKASLYKQPEN